MSKFERAFNSLISRISFRVWAQACLVAWVVGCLLQPAGAQESKSAQDMKSQIARGHEMLSEIKKDIQDNYYDRGFRGVNLDEHFAAADKQIAEAVSGDQIYGIIANALLIFDDSHTFFIPPIWSMRVEYGWKMQLVGEKCYVTSVEPGSDASGKGLRVGEQVLAIFDVPITRQNLWQIEYLFYRLRPLKAIVVTTQNTSGQRRRVELLTKVTTSTWATVGQLQREASQSIQYYRKLEGDVFNWKMPEFDLSEKGVDQMMKKVAQHKALILDLRDNGGGYEETLQNLLGYFFDRDVKICDRKGRKESKPVLAKTRGAKAFKGQLVVLVNSRSASAAELFARIVQLEKRGTVLGDRTAGAVTEARHFPHEYVRRKGFLVSALAVTYAVSVTVNDLIMTDGKSLERVGVTPDEIILPSPQDLADENDPVLARAAQLTGSPLDLKKTKPDSFQKEIPRP